LSITWSASTPVRPRDRPGFALITLHIDSGAAADRTAEITTFANWLKRQAAVREDFNANVLALGDFNIDRMDDANGRPFLSAGMSPPAELINQPRSIFDAGSTAHDYDQIAWFTAGNTDELTGGSRITTRCLRSSRCRYEASPPSRWSAGHARVSLGRRLLR
jgi:hypothetical protein